MMPYQTTTSTTTITTIQLSLVQPQHVFEIKRTILLSNSHCYAFISPWLRLFACCDLFKAIKKAD